MAALLAPFVLVTSAAQGASLIRCLSSGEVSASCCCDEEKPPPRNEVAPVAGQCCDRVLVPETQPQIEQRSITSVQPPVAVAAIQQPLPLIGALQRALPIPRHDPPPAPSPLLVACSLLI